MNKTVISMWKEMSNPAILLEMGKRIKEHRIRKNLQQKEVAEYAGISLSTVIRLEKGEAVGTDKLIAALRVLGMLENLKSLLPELPISPILMRKLQKKKKHRIRKDNANE